MPTLSLAANFGGLAVFFALIGQEAIAAEPFVLTSSTFKDGGILPIAAAGSRPGNANCVGQNISPELSWSNAPEGTKTLVRP